MALIIICVLVVVIWLALNAQAQKRKRTAASPPPRVPLYDDELVFPTRHIRLELPLVRLDAKTSPSSDPPMPAPTAPDVAPDPRGELMNAHGIALTGGRYVVKGYGFSELAQAVNYARRLAAHGEAEPRGGASVSAVATPSLASLPVATASASRASILAPSPHATRMADHGVTYHDGRYVAGAYGFSTLDQAVAFASRKGEGRPDPSPPVETRTVAPMPARSQALAAAPARLSPGWIAAGDGLQIGPVRVPGGMIYAGHAGASAEWLNERSLVDPSLQVSLSGTDPLGSSLPYWPSYRDLTSNARRSYLDWLAAGRVDPVGVGYVFLFFYGLERRLFIDKAFKEAESIIAEVARLRVAYGDNYSFDGYARRFLEAAELVRSGVVERPILSPRMGNGEFEIPLPARRYLGARLAEQLPFDADDCLVWALCLPDTYLRTPGSRCFEELAVLWRLRFDRRHPEGLKVRAPKRRLTGQYRSASSAFELTLDLGDLPDIAAIAAPLSGLRDLLSECQTDLEAYSRLLGRKPEARGTLEAALCLPDDLIETDWGLSARALKAEFDAIIGDQTIVPMAVTRLCDLIGMDQVEGKVPVGIHRQFGVVLDRLQIAFEPDRRYGDAGLTSDSQVVLYRAAGGGPIDCEQPAYRSVRTMAEISAIAAISDGEVVSAELDQIEAVIRAATDLRPEERTRLSAYAMWLLQDRPRQLAAITKLSKLPVPLRTEAARAAVASVLSDGRVQPAEIRFLEKLYRALGLPQDEVYATLHRGPASRDEPVTVAEAAPAAKDGVAIPQEPVVPTTVQIDPARLARLRLETAEVSSLLAGIFAEEEAPVAPPAVAETTSARFEGLDVAHSELLGAVVDACGLDRATFDTRAKALKLLPDGAIETINDWAFDRFDEPVLEGDDDLTCPEPLRLQLLALDLAA
ncbi:MULTISPECIES: TerB N-terminal domain-containing protein [unclassified Brevundimonas]|uniref:tellurite resistance TerB family protein n=1 Tax=unclassified Brevundimonas TaxID=2622653 RepID=UPI00128F1431|nr:MULTISPECIES: TerB N-terminal domain-containing protein [unclassified Brevundimonas]